MLPTNPDDRVRSLNSVDIAEDDWWSESLTRSPHTCAKHELEEREQFRKWMLAYSRLYHLSIRNEENYTFGESSKFV